MKKKVTTLSGTGILVLVALVAGLIVVDQGNNTNASGKITIPHSMSYTKGQNKVVAGTSLTNDQFNKSITDNNYQGGSTSYSSGSTSKTKSDARTNKTTNTNKKSSTSNTSTPNSTTPSTTTPLPTIFTPNPVVTPIPGVAPSVAITSPAASSTISGTIAVNANATGSSAITGVQFMLDGSNLGSAVTSAPYTTSFNTASVANGNHSLTAVATNVMNLSSTSAAVTVNVQNVVTPPVVPVGNNLIVNPSFEENTNGAPTGWTQGGFGINTPTYNYLSTGHTGNHSANVTMTTWTDGDIKWVATSVSISAGQSYKFSDFYRSNVATQVDVSYLIGGVQTFALLGIAPASSVWAPFNSQFTVPVGATAVTVYHTLAAVGTLTTDDYSLTSYVPAAFNRGIVSVTFDDGWTNQFTNAVPTLNSLGIKSTFYIISGELQSQPEYMSISNIQSLVAAGHEIASHSVSHTDLTTLSTAAMQAEMQNSKNTLQTTFGITVNNFAYPFGAFNDATVAVGKTLYISQRDVTRGFNTKDGFDLVHLKIQEVDSNISIAQVQGYINAAIAQKTWLILVFHEIATTPIAPDNALYTTQPADFIAEMSYLKNSGVAIETVNQAIAELQPQI